MAFDPTGDVMAVATSSSRTVRLYASAGMDKVRERERVRRDCERVRDRQWQLEESMPFFFSGL